MPIGAIDFFDQKEVQALQEEKFQRVWSHIAATPLYVRKLDEAGIRTRQIPRLSQLEELPFTHKAEVRNTSVLYRTPLNVKDIYAVYSSGGTSGDKTLYAWGDQDVAVQQEVAGRLVGATGTSSADMGLVVAPINLPVMGHCMLRQYSAVGASFIPFGQGPPEDIVSLLRSLPITSVATLSTIAARLFEHLTCVMGQEVDEEIQVKQFLLGGDILSNAKRVRLEQAWKAKCYDFYGISEVFGPLAGECACQNGMHVAADQVLIEILDPLTKRPVPEGEAGVAVYTTLWEKAFPLLRYWSDDYITFTWEPCACGRSSPRMRFLGRTADFARLQGRLLFAKEVEEAILRFPVSTEFYCEYREHDGRAAVYVNVEPMEDPLPAREISDALAHVFGLPIQLTTHKPGSLARTDAKPKRLLGFPGAKHDADRQES